MCIRWIEHTYYRRLTWDFLIPELSRIVFEYTEPTAEELWNMVPCGSACQKTPLGIICVCTFYVLSQEMYARYLALKDDDDWNLRKSSAKTPRGCWHDEESRRGRPLSKNDSTWIMARGITLKHPGYPYRTAGQYAFYVWLRRYYASMPQRSALLLAIYFFD
jgi:hypothetical protein